MVHLLETPQSPDELYLARGGEINAVRPIMTGDVLTGIDIPGMVGTSGLTIIVTHPCSLRSDGVQLVERLLVAGVAPHSQPPPPSWSKGLAFRMMPLPALRPDDDSNYVAVFDDLAMAPAKALLEGQRVACLSVRGVNLLQQRFVHYLTRLVVPTFQLQEVSGSVFEEAELLERWLEVATDAGVSVEEATGHFHDHIRGERYGQRRQELLSDPEYSSAVRREAMDACRDLYNLS